MAQSINPTPSPLNRKVRKIVVNNVDYNITTDDINLVFIFSNRYDVDLVKGDIKEAYASFINHNGLPINISATLVSTMAPDSGRIYNANKITFYQEEYEEVLHTVFEIQFSGLGYASGSATYDTIYIQGSFTDDDFYCMFNGVTSYEMTQITPSSPGNDPVTE